MNKESHVTRQFFATLALSTVTACAPGRCWAADGASLPWDYTLNFLQHLVAGPIAHSVIVLSIIAALLAFALAGDSELARRLAKTAFGTALALIVVELLNYLVP
jgi:type IV secretory pathway VirB2 component (pilin)